MMAHLSTGDGAVFKKALGAIVALIIARLVFTLNAASAFCTPTSTWTQVITLGFDVLTIVVTPLLVVLYGEQTSRRARIIVVAMTLVGLALYELARNPCLISGLGR